MADFPTLVSYKLGPPILARMIILAEKSSLTLRGIEMKLWLA
jgi:hypothetical protein